MSWKSPASVQVVNGVGPTAPEVAEHYFEWMTERLPGVTVDQVDGRIAMYVSGSSKPAIVLRPADKREDRASFNVIGGYLVASRPSGSFVFAKDTTTLTIALRDFAPRLPAPVYLVSHHLVHAAVMSAFCRQLKPLQIGMNV